MPKIRKTIGTTVDIWGTFKDPQTDEFVDPDELELVVVNPDDESLGYDLSDFVRDSEGQYYMPVTLDTRGTWRWYWTAGITGPPPKGVVLTGQLDAVPEL